MNLLSPAFEAQAPRKRSWITRRVTVGASNVHGLGLFASRPISCGQLVVELGGLIFAFEDIKAGRARQNSVTGFDEGLYLGHPPLVDGQPVPIDEFLNHSCEPTLWLCGRTKLVARRSVLVGEELTIDYATWEIDNEWQLGRRCTCRSSDCRHEITGMDWRIRDLQRRYAGHMLPCLEARIRAAAGYEHAGQSIDAKSG